MLSAIKKVGGGNIKIKQQKTCNYKERMEEPYNNSKSNLKEKKAWSSSVRSGDLITPKTMVQDSNARL